MRPARIPRWRSWVGSLVAVTAVMALAAMHCNALDPSGQEGAAEETDQAPAEGRDDLAHEMELVTVGVDMVTRLPVVLLRESKSGQTLPVWVGPVEAQAIILAMQGIETPRPMTHDLLAAVLRELDVELVKVRIDALRENTYHGKLVLRVGDEDRTRIVDTRPSDGMALAVRTGAPIEVSDAVLQATPDIQFMPLREGEQVVSLLGITVVGPTEDRRQQFSFPDRPGVVVVEAVGEARRRGLERGDLIIAVEDETPASPMEFLEAVQAAAEAAGPDSVIRIRYFRGETEHEIDMPTEVLPRRPVPDREVV